MSNRASGSSHIPQPTRRSRSKSITRTSSTAGSSTKRSISLSGCSRKFTTPTVGKKSSGGAKNSIGTTPLSALTSQSSFLKTPGSVVRSRSKSPRSVNDKNWVNQQFQKVKAFVQQHPYYIEHKPELKPFSTNTFVTLCGFLLKEINPYLEISNANYKDIVPKMLKLLNYPGIMSNSLFKTVNTTHSWPQVISILSWLIDLVESVKTKVDLESLPPHLQRRERFLGIICERYKAYNKGEPEDQEDAKFMQKLGEIFQIDEVANAELRNEVSELAEFNLNLDVLCDEEKLKNENMKAEIKRKQDEIDEFYAMSSQTKQDRDEKMALLKARKQSLIRIIDQKSANLIKLKEQVKSQRYTIEEKKAIEKRIEEMKHTNNLLKERRKQKLAMKEKFEEKVSSLKQNIESEVFRLNDSLMEPAAKLPELKGLLLNEKDFGSQAFKENVDEVVKNFKMFDEKINTELVKNQSSLVKQQKQNDDLVKKIEQQNGIVKSMFKSEQQISQSMVEVRQEIEMVNQKNEVQKDQFEKKMVELKEKSKEFEYSKQIHVDVREMKNRVEEEFEVRKQTSLEFFVKLHELIISSLEDAAKIRDEVLEMLVSCLRELDQKQEKIVADLKNLKDLNKNADDKNENKG